MTPWPLYAFVVGGAIVLLAAYFLLRSKPKTPEDLERERREWLDRVGRITDGCQCGWKAGQCLFLII